MLTDLPLYVYVTFMGSVFLVLLQFYFASGKNIKAILAIFAWGALHSILALSGFYQDFEAIPPRLLFIGGPALIIILTTIFSEKVKSWLNTFDLKQLTYLNIVRIPVELVLFWLFVGGYVPELMTFAGRNFDILMGITAPVVALVAIKGSEVKKGLLIGWNIISLILLAQIVGSAVLSTPTVLQQMGFEQPNVAIFYFPIVLLPAIIVPLVYIANAASLVILNRLK